MPFWGSFTSSFGAGRRPNLVRGIYSVAAAAGSIDEGSALTINVTTENVRDGTTLYWNATNSGEFGTASGSFTINSNAGSFTVTPSTDASTEGSETFQIQIRRINSDGPIVATSDPITINDTSLEPVYSVTPASFSVNEATSVTVNVATENVADGTTLYWTVTNAGSDFFASSGSFTINSDAGSFSITPLADQTTEGEETFQVQIRTGSTGGDIVATSGVVTINDTSITPEYSISPSSATINEGQAATFTVTTVGVGNNTRFYWATTSGLDALTSQPDRSGNFLINNGTGSFNVIADQDQAPPEGTKTATISVRSGQFSPVFATVTVTVLDTSTETFSITTAPSVDEGSSLEITLTAQAAPDDYVYYWTVSNPDDFESGSGSVTINPGGAGTQWQGTITLTALADGVAEGLETFTISIRRDSVSGTIVFTSDPISIAEPSDFNFSPESVSFDGSNFQATFFSEEPGSSEASADAGYSYAGWLNATRKGTLTVTADPYFSNFDTGDPAGFDSISVEYDLNSAPTVQVFEGFPANAYRIEIAATYTNPIDPDPFGSNFGDTVSIAVATSQTENELTNVGWRYEGNIDGGEGVMILCGPGEYEPFLAFIQSRSLPSFAVRYDGVNYFITLTSDNIQNSTSFYGGGDGGVVSMRADIWPSINLGDVIGFNEAPLSWLKFWAPFQLTFSSDTLDAYSRDPNEAFSSGTSTFTFSDNAAAELFAANLVAIGEIRANATLCAPFIQNVLQVGIDPATGIQCNVNITNSVAATATSSGSTVTIAHTNTSGSDPSSGSGNWRIISSMTYQDPSGFGSLSFSGGSATLTLPSAVAETLAAELAGGGGGSGFNNNRRMSIRSDIGGSTAFVFFEVVTNIAGSGSDLTFNYVDAFNDGDFGPPYLLVSAS